MATGPVGKGQGSKGAYQGLETGVAGPYHCDICSQSFLTKTELSEHCTHHQQLKRYRCGICRYLLPDRSVLRQHLLQHSNEFTHFCYPCGKGFKSYTGHYRHEKLFHRPQTNNPKCEICGRQFPDDSSLKIHYRRHSDDRPFKCEMCGKSYKHKKSLQDHTCNP